MDATQARELALKTLNIEELSEQTYKQIQTKISHAASVGKLSTTVDLNEYKLFDYCEPSSSEFLTRLSQLLSKFSADGFAVIPVLGDEVSITFKFKISW